MSTRLVEPTDRHDRQVADNGRGVITGEQAADLLGVDARTVRTWATVGRLTVVAQTLGSDHRGGWRSFDRSEVESLAELLRAGERVHGSRKPRWTAPPLTDWRPTARSSTSSTDPSP